MADLLLRRLDKATLDALDVRNREQLREIERQLIEVALAAALAIYGETR